MKKNTRHYHYSQLFTITQGVTPPTGDTPEILQVSHKNLSVRQYVLYMECVRDQTWNIWNHCDAPLWVVTKVSFFIYINAGKVSIWAVLELTHLTETPRVRVNTNNWFLHFLTSFGLSWPLTRNVAQALGVKDTSAGGRTEKMCSTRQNEESKRDPSAQPSNSKDYLIDWPVLPSCPPSLLPSPSGWPSDGLCELAP